MTIFLFDREENTVGKEENTAYQHFHLFPVFSKASFLRVIKSRDCVVKSFFQIFELTNYHNIDQPADVNPCGITFKYLNKTT